MICMRFRAFSCGSWGVALGTAPLGSSYCVSLVANLWCEVGSRGMLSLWNRAVGMPASCIMQMAFVENLGLGEWAPASWF